jgi:membrane protein required for colicin V production
VQTLDMIFIILAGLLVLRGFLKGFTGEFFSVVSVVLALIASVLLFKNGAGFIRSRYLQMEFLPEILAFLIIFISVFILGKIIERIVKDIIARTNLDALDKVLGIIIGLAEGFAIIVILLFLLTIQPLFDSSSLLEQSFIAKFLLPLMEAFHV